MPVQARTSPLLDTGPDGRVPRVLAFAGDSVMAIAPLPLAHAGHVLVDLLMVSPVIVLILWFAVITIRDRRRGVDSEDPRPEQALVEEEDTKPV